jgi:metal-responsive CopG/Arc/MetJ family transcriptional regulator
MVKNVILLFRDGVDKGRNIFHTKSMKTAISIPDELFEEVDRIARESGSSRSQVFCLAVKEYLEKLRARKLLEDLNTAYKGEELAEEKLLRKKSVEYYQKKILE